MDFAEGWLSREGMTNRASTPTMRTLQIQRQLWSPPAGAPPGAPLPGAPGRGDGRSGRWGLTRPCYSPPVEGGDRPERPGTDRAADPAPPGGARSRPEAGGIVSPMAPPEHQEPSRRRRPWVPGPPTGVVPDVAPVARDGSGSGPTTAPAGTVRFPGDPGAPPLSRGDAGVWFVLALTGFVAGQVVALLLVDVAASIAGKGAQLSQIAKLAAPPEWYVVSSLVGLWTGFGLSSWLASRVRGTGATVADLGIRFRWIDLAGIGVGLGGQILVALMYAPFINHLHNFRHPPRS